MKSEKVKEIKKALASSFCRDIAYVVNIDGEHTMKRLWIGSVINLINELESENERLIAEKQKVLEYMKTDNYAKLKKEDMYWGYQMGIGMLEHEIDRQKDRIAELKLEIQKAHNKGVQAGFDMTKFKEHSIKKQASKETAEKILCKIKNIDTILKGYYLVSDIDLDDIAKQFGVEIKE